MLDMIIVSATTTLKNPTARDGLIAASIAVTKEALATPGCSAFWLAVDANNPRVMYHYEEWESLEVLDAHMSGELRSAFRDNIASHLQNVVTRTFEAEPITDGDD